MAWDISYGNDKPRTILKKSIVIYTILVLLFFSFASLTAQNYEQKILLTIDDAISFAHKNSYKALEARNTLLISHWSFQTYKVELLPTLSFNADLANINRSLVALQDANTADIYYRRNFNMRNRGNLSLNQNIALTGGKLSLYTNILRLDQYKPSRLITYYSEPLALSYTQSLGGYNQLKWSKKIEPEKYELAKRKYLESMSTITLEAVDLFYNTAIEQMKLNIAKRNYQNTSIIYGMALKKLNLGTITKNELKQVELKLINDSIVVNDSNLRLIQQTQSIRLYLGLDKHYDIEIFIDEELPNILLDEQQVFSHIIHNSTFSINHKIQEIEAENEIARAKSNSRINSQIQIRFGVSNSKEEFKNVYKNLLDQEIISVSLSIPLIDWGSGKREVLIAKKQAETIKEQILYSYREFEQEIFNDVERFNYQRSKCLLSDKARILANEWYELNVKNFENNSIKITDLNISQAEKDEAFMNYINELKNYWMYYYQIQQKSLYDYISSRNISTELDKILQ